MEKLWQQKQFCTQSKSLRENIAGSIQENGQSADSLKTQADILIADSVSIHKKTRLMECLNPRCALISRNQKMALGFSWQYFWSYYQRIGRESVRKAMQSEVLADNWLFDQPAEAQIEVLEHAPQDFIEQIKAHLKPDTVKILTPEISLIDWSKL